MMKAWSERKEIKQMISRISAAAGTELLEREQEEKFWGEYAEDIRPDLEAADRLQAESMAKSFTKVVRA